MRENCFTCTHRIGKGEKFCCVYCDRVLHFTPECTGFPEQSIEVLIELKHNLLHVCNDCTHKKTNNEPLEEKQKQQMQLNFDDINKKISDCSENVLKSFKIMEEMQKEINSLKTKPAYSAVVGKATAGKLVDVPVLETKKLGIRVKGIPEAGNENADKRLATDRTEIISLLHYLGVETKITKLSRVGQYDKNKGPWTILFDLETQVDTDQAVKSAYKLKTYRIQSKPIFLSAELNKDDAMKENEALKLGRQLIDKGIDPKILRVRNLALQKLRYGVWSTISDITESDWLSSEPSTAPIIETVTLLSFNVRSLLDHKRRAALANCLLPLDYDI